MIDNDHVICIGNYNLWFDNHDQEKRTKKLCDVIIKNKIDVLCMQEVTSKVYDKIKLSMKYHYPKKITKPYECAIISNYPILNTKTIQLPSNMGRKLIIIKISVNGTNVIVCTTHFESEFKKDNCKKIKQFDYVATILNRICDNYKNVIFCSDTNIINNEEFIFNSSFYKFSDGWEICGSNEKNKYTYDYNTNKYLKGKFCARLDRILFRCKNIECGEFNLIKEDVSDHHGAIIKFKFANH